MFKRHSKKSKIRPLQYLRCHVQNPINTFKRFKHMNQNFKRVWTVYCLNLFGTTLIPVFKKVIPHISRPEPLPWGVSNLI